MARKPGARTVGKFVVADQKIAVRNKGPFIYIQNKAESLESSCFC
jgi:hypothetical protein